MSHCYECGICSVPFLFFLVLLGTEYERVREVCAIVCLFCFIWWLVVCMFTFVCLFVRSFVRSFVCLFLCSFVRSFNQSINQVIDIKIVRYRWLCSSLLTSIIMLVCSCQSLHSFVYIMMLRESTVHPSLFHH